MRSWRESGRVAAVVVVAGVAAGVIVLAGTAGSAAPEPHIDTWPSSAPAGARLLVRAVDPDATRADGALYELGPTGAHRVGHLSCKRVYVAQRGKGLCLRLSSNGVDYDGIVFDDRYREVTRFPVEGIPDRARISPDGRYGAYTSFDPRGAQQYFATPGKFKTFTRIVDMRTGRELLDLDMVLASKGDRFIGEDVAAWGVTFAGGGRYYATVALGRRHLLIAGRIGSRRFTVLRDGVECPALSPNGRRIAYKHRIGRANRWRLHVLDLRSGRDIALAEQRSIDDQPEWLGDDTVVYSDDRDVLSVPADGSGRPERIATGATSPAAHQGASVTSRPS